MRIWPRPLPSSPPAPRPSPTELAWLPLALLALPGTPAAPLQLRPSRMTAVPPWPKSHQPVLEPSTGSWCESEGVLSTTLAHSRRRSEVDGPEGGEPLGFDEMTGIGLGGRAWARV
jgi:hypothetical protein